MFLWSGGRVGAGECSQPVDRPQLAA